LGVNRREFLFSSACACLATGAARIETVRAGPALSPKLYRCGTPPPTPSDDIQTNRVMDALREHRVTFRKTVIPIRFHIIHDGARGYLPHRRLVAQVESLNRAFEPAGIAFRIADARLHENKAWFTHEPGSRAEIEMKTELGKDTARALNIYTAAPGGGLSGYATFPWSQAASPERDGIVIHHASLPDAARSSGAETWPLEPGMAVAHQIGHWAGGFDHASQRDCGAPGDDADSSGNACMTEFTPDQYQRIKDMVGYYRYQLSPLTSRSALLAEIRKSIE
jgi:hypothetical protein